MDLKNIYVVLKSTQSSTRNVRVRPSPSWISPVKNEEQKDNNKNSTAVREFEKGMCALSSLNDRVNACIRKEIEGDKVEKGESPDFWETNLVTEMILYIQLARYNEAKDLWNRSTSSNTPPKYQKQLSVLQAITNAILSNDSTLAFSLIYSITKEDPESTLEKSFVSQMMELEIIYRARIEFMLARTYRKIQSSKIQALLGFNTKEETFKYLSISDDKQNSRWTVSPTNSEFLIPSPSLATMSTTFFNLDIQKRIIKNNTPNDISMDEDKITDDDERDVVTLEQKLQHLTSIVSYMERKHLDV